QNLSTIKGAYLKATQKLGKPPARQEDIMPFLQEVGEPEQILRSSNDGEPYVIIWGVDIRRYLDKGIDPVVAYEKNGKDGKRVVSHGHFVRIETDEEFQKDVFPAGHKPSS